MTDDSDTDTDVARPANTAGSDMPAIVSNATLFVSKVDITRLSCAAEADAGRTSPRTVQTTFALPLEVKLSDVVDKVIPMISPAFAAPIVKPLKMMLKTVVAAMPTTAKVMTMQVKAAGSVPEARAASNQ
jgi:hypothetical protein